jgi:hypothetical protein
MGNKEQYHIIKGGLRILLLYHHSDVVNSHFELQSSVKPIAFLDSSASVQTSNQRCDTQNIRDQITKRKTSLIRTRILVFLVLSIRTWVPSATHIKCGSLVEILVLLVALYGIRKVVADERKSIQNWLSFDD